MGFDPISYFFHIYGFGWPLGSSTLRGHYDRLKWLMKKHYFLIFLSLLVSACSEPTIDTTTSEPPQVEEISTVEPELKESSDTSEPIPSTEIEIHDSTYWEEQNKIEEEHYDEMPQELQSLIDYSYAWSSLAQHKFSPDNKKIAYIYNFEIHLYTIASQKDELLMSLYTDTTDISGFHWSPNQSKLAMVVYNSAQVHTDYPEGSKVFVLSFEEDGLIKKDKYNVYIPTSTPCSDQGCFPHRFGFTDETTLHYFTNSAGGGVDWSQENYESEMVEKWINL